MKRLVGYIGEVLRFSLQLTFETLIGAVMFTLTIAVASVLLYFILRNAIE